MRKIGTEALIEKDGKVLFISRNKKEGEFHKKGILIGPGGKLEQGETMEQCIVREIEEETGLKIKNPKLKAIMKYPDFRKGGGFEYVGSFMPLENLPEAFRESAILAKKHGHVPTLLARLIGKGHNVMFSSSYPFNRADPKDMEIARNALHDTDKLVLRLGGIPWKVELDGQKLIVEQMDPGYKKLFHMIRSNLDPNGIMNPGNWEVS